MSDLKECHDCGAKPGEQHKDGCDTERCRLCGGQAISCGCFLNLFETASWMERVREMAYAAFDDHLDNEGGRLPWTGEWPGVEECREFGWYSKMVPGRGWVRCAKDDPEASEDLNRLHEGECVWDVKRGRWVKR